MTPQKTNERTNVPEPGDSNFPPISEIDLDPLVAIPVDSSFPIVADVPVPPGPRWRLRRGPTRTPAIPSSTAFHSD